MFSSEGTPHRVWPAILLPESSVTGQSWPVLFITRALTFCHVLLACWAAPGSHPTTWCWKCSRWVRLEPNGTIINSPLWFYRHLILTGKTPNGFIWGGGEISTYKQQTAHLKSSVQSSLTKALMERGALFLPIYTSVGAIPFLRRPQQCPICSAYPQRELPGMKMAREKWGYLLDQKCWWKRSTTPRRQEPVPLTSTIKRWLGNCTFIFLLLFDCRFNLILSWQD